MLIYPVTIINIILNNANILRVTFDKFLGVIIDDKFNWKHILLLIKTKKNHMDY